MNKKGFISMTLVYTFLILFLFLMLAILNSYSRKNSYLETIDNKIKNEVILRPGALNTSSVVFWYNNCTSSSTTLNCKMITNTAHGNAKPDTNIEYNKPSSVSGDLGLYYTTGTKRTQNGERVFFYRGAVTNNYVLFAGFCWRIIRTNENASVRLRYGGTPVEINGALTCPQTGSDVYTHTNVAFNAEYDDNRYVGYMFGTTCDTYANCHKNNQASDMKELLETWYDTNLNTYTSSHIEDAVYCNDRTINQNEGPYFGLTNTKKGFESEITFYGAAGRLTGPTSDEVWTGAHATAQPTYKCERNDDKFTVSNTLGNGKNLKPIGLITADEIAYAGGEWYSTDESSNNATYYLYTGQFYWGMSPSRFLLGNSYMTIVSTTGILYGTNVSRTDARVLPVISLKNTVTVSSGSGAYNSPYVIQ